MTLGFKQLRLGQENSRQLTEAAKPGFTGI
jgi:hypothetical protein